MAVSQRKFVRFLIGVMNLRLIYFTDVVLLIDVDVAGWIAELYSVET
jgi:hypothetical protein